MGYGALRVGARDTPPFRDEAAKGWGTHGGGGVLRGCALDGAGDFDGGWVVFGVVAEAVPRPLIGFGDETTGDRVAMNIAELFDAPGLCVDVEIVVPRLPDFRFLPGSGKGLFEDLDGGG